MRRTEEERIVKGVELEKERTGLEIDWNDEEGMKRNG